LAVSAACVVVLMLGCGLTLLHPKVYFEAFMAVRTIRSRLGWVHVDLDGAGRRLSPLLGAGETLPLNEAKIVVRKTERRLELYSSGRILKSYRIGLGGQPRGHKRSWGDGRTPEGVYYICTRRLNTRDHLFLGLNYPDAADAAEGLKAKLITPEQARAIQDADHDHKAPPWNTPLGGLIGIHGGGAKDWTAGCIGLTDEDAEEIFAATAHWTLVEIIE
jgi:murein L,D-transpeptidase YafK